MQTRGTKRCLNQLYSTNDNTNHNSTANIHQVGYQIFKQAIPIESQVLNKISTACKRAYRIFNHNENAAYNDGKRKQCSLPLKSKYMQKFDQHVREFVKHNLSTTLTPNNPVILRSLANCQAQAAHCDYLPTEISRVPDHQMPLAIVICLEEGTKLQIWPNSSHLVKTPEKDLAKMEPIECIESKLAPGDILAFRGDFVHAGSSYSQENRRIHYYLDSPHVDRRHNRTWIIKQHASHSLKQLIKPLQETSNKRLKLK